MSADRQTDTQTINIRADKRTLYKKVIIYTLSNRIADYL